MPISQERALRHTEEWTKKCVPKFWPKYLFHHANVNSAAAAIVQGELISRSSQNQLIHDVANQDALNCNPQVHDYVRLYFRPLTDFHLRTEGIRLRSDRYRLERHMSIPIVFMFKLADLLQLDGVGYSGRKLAHPGLLPGFSEAAFDAIEFSSVYHEGPLTASRRQDVNDKRMAEVVVPQSLALGEHLAHIVCRTSYDEITLRHLVGAERTGILRKIRVADTPRNFFMCWGLFIQELEFQNQHLTIKLHPGKCASSETAKYRVEQWVEGNLHASAEFERTILQGSRSPIKISPFSDTATAVWKIWIEDVLAFEGTLPYGRSQLVS